jgi:hypothetical protein
MDAGAPAVAVRLIRDTAATRRRREEAIEAAFFTISYLWCADKPTVGETGLASYPKKPTPTGSACRPAFQSYFRQPATTTRAFSRS